MIYFLQRANGDVKIGVTVDYPQRLNTLQKVYGPLVLLGWHEGERDNEQSLHRSFDNIRLYGEWFIADESLMQYIANNCKASEPPGPAPRRKTRQIRVTDDTWRLLKYMARKRSTTIAEVMAEMFSTYKDRKNA